MRSKKRDQTQYQKEHAADLLYNVAKSRCRKNGREFTITKEDVVIPEFCPVLGCKIDTSRGKGRQRNGASLDRIDNTKGYIPGNVWVISALANRMKQDATIEELRAFGKWACNL